jgi:hypothetical protein
MNLTTCPEGPSRQEVSSKGRENYMSKILYKEYKTDHVTKNKSIRWI